MLTVYFYKDQIKDLATRIGLTNRTTIIHQFHPEVLLRSSVRDQYAQQNPSHEKTHIRSSSNTKFNPLHEHENPKEASMHTFIDLSKRNQQNSINHSKSAADLFLYH